VAQEELARKFGELVRRLRLERGLSQEEFAFRVGLHQTYVSRVERGERNVTIGTADRIAGTLGTPWRRCSRSWSGIWKTAGMPGETGHRERGLQEGAG
jgi:transcriptional regulator with XRE-family HTH domain